MSEPNVDAGALTGVRILDLSRVLAGPLCTMILADLGADVIKVERPGTGDETRTWGPPWVGGPEGRESAYYLSINRNKRSVTADLSDADDAAMVRQLAHTADVIVENFAPGSLDRRGLGYPALAEANPRLIYCTISGYGTKGPEAGRPGYDFAVQARSGWMSITGEHDGDPMKVGVAVVDVLTGQNAAIAILAALSERHRSGRGQIIEIALMDSAMAGLVNVVQSALTGAPTRRYGNAHPTIVPYQAFPTATDMIVVAVGNDDQWRRFCAAAGLEALALDPRFATNPARVENRETVVRLIADRLRTAPAAEWLNALETAGVPCEQVCTVEEAIRDPVFRERQGFWTMESDAYGSVEVVASPLRLERTPPMYWRPAPSLGEHDDEVRSRGWSLPTG